MRADRENGVIDIATKSNAARGLRRADFITDRFLVTVGPDSTFSITRRHDGASLGLGTDRPLVALLFAFRDDPAALDSVIGWLFASKRVCHRSSEPRHDLAHAMQPMALPLRCSNERQLEALRIYATILRGTQIGDLIARRARAVARDALAPQRFNQVEWHEAYRRLGRKIPARVAARLAA